VDLEQKTLRALDVLVYGETIHERKFSKNNPLPFQLAL